MVSFDTYSVDQVNQPVRILEVTPVSLATHSCQETNVSTVNDITAYFENSRDDFTCRLISICQRSSWSPLQITKPMLDTIASKHGLSSSFWELASCFYDRELGFEENFCLPYSEVRSGSFIEVSYTLRYPEYKPNEDKWTIRQTGIYHKHDTATGQSLFVLLSPTPGSRAHCKAEEMLRSPWLGLDSDAFRLHQIPFVAYFSAWREYTVSLEKRFLPLSHCLFGEFIHKPLAVGYDSLSELATLESRLFQIPTMLAAATETIDELCLLFEFLSQTPESRHVIMELKNQRRQCIAHSRAASPLQQRIHSVSGLLANTLLFRDQFVAKEQNSNIFQLNKSAVFLTTLGLLYLPSSFMASFFGMNFFAMDEANSTIVATPMIWIFILSSAALTAFTFLLYYGLLHQDSTTFQKLIPKGNIASEWNIQAIKRQLTFGNRRDLDLQDSKA